jgi:hypothetical protein
MMVAYCMKGKPVPFAHRPDARIWWEQSATGDPILGGAIALQVALDHPGQLEEIRIPELVMHGSPFRYEPDAAAAAGPGMAWQT